MATASEFKRQTVHILVGALALALRYLTWWQAIVCSLGAALLNRFVLPRLAPGIFRAGDFGALGRSGIVIYPLSVTVLILCFPARLDLVAAAWGILAAGDGFATLIGAHVRSRRLPWNADKSVAGLLSFIVFGSAAAIGLAAWTGSPAGPLPLWWVIAAPATAAVVAAFVESAPVRLDDNISVPAAAAAVLWSMQWIEEPALLAGGSEAAARLPLAVAINAAVAGAGWVARTVTIPGAIAGALIGTAVFAGAGWPAWLLLMAAFLAAAVSTRAGHARKARAGIAEERGGRRGPGNAIANTGLAAWCALVSVGLPPGRSGFAWLALAAALATAASDTVASEVGKAWGRTTWLVTGWRRVPPGTSGAISLEGTAAGVASAAILAGLAWQFGLIGGASVPIVAAAATIASLAEGLLGATYEASGVFNNDALNLVNSALGAALAIGGVRLLGFHP